MGLEDVLSAMRSAEGKAGREGNTVGLVAVSKVQPEERVEAVLAEGHRVFGENRVQEAQDRWTKRREQYPELKLHLIGPLQTNKVRPAVALFDVIETVDREKLARKIAAEAAAQNKTVEVFIQVNTGDEAQKAGVAVEESAELIELCRNELKLNVVGLMAIPPIDEDPAPHFALLAKMAKEAGLPKLSMGMSGDYEIAIAMGATQVRIGSAVFGARKQSAAG
ncbi:MAG: YggS family pyridoxal phosphate-dependent enzyme [Pseudomonadota bacterium]